MAKFLINKTIFVFCILNLVFNVQILYAFPGWDYVAGQYVFRDDDDNFVLNAFRASDTGIFYLGEDGFVVKNTPVIYDGSIYYMDMNGRRVENMWLDITDDNNLNGEIKNGRYYFDYEGKNVKANNNSFIRNINGDKYIFDEYGRVLKGFIDENGNNVEYGSVIKDGIYYADEMGTLYKNKWLKFSDMVEFYYEELDESEISATPYDDYNEVWFYFDSSGKRVRSEDGVVKQKEIDGKKYGFDENGIMILGLVKTEGVDYNQASNPTMLSEVKVFDPTGDGKLMRNSWYWSYPTKNLDEDENSSKEYSWWHTDGRGNLEYNKIVTIDGKKYAFDGLGRMKTGFVFVDGKSIYVANYDPDTLKRDDFIYDYDMDSKLYGKELSDLYFFSTNEEEDGSMKVGEMEIELADGVYTFYFTDSGKAYGNKNSLKKYQNVYYYNGLKLTALNDNHYGIVKIDDSEYRVIGQSGKIVTGHKKIIRDENDGYIVMMNDKFVGYLNGTELEGDSYTLKYKSNKGNGEAGYYFYINNKDSKLYNKKNRYVELFVASGTTTPSDESLSKLPDDLKVNFR